MSFTRTKKLTDAEYSPPYPSTEEEIRQQMDGSIDEVFQFFNPYFDTPAPNVSAMAIQAYNGTNPALASHLADFAKHRFNVKDYGAKGDNINDDAPAIQNTIDYAYANGGGVVFIPKGIYRLKTGQGANLIYIRPRPGIILEGEGDASVLIADDGVNTNSSFNVIRHTSDDTYPTIDNVIFRNFKIDCNGANNLVPNGSPNKDNVAIGIRSGSNITVDNVTVVNNAGRQCFSFGSNTSPHTVKNLKILNCHIYKVATDITGNIYQTDHSCIYAQADGCIIENNIIENENIITIGTAIENHSNNSVVSHNIVKNMNVSCNVVSTVTDHKNNAYINNTFNNIQQAFQFFTTAGFTMENIKIEGNIIQQYSGNSPIFSMKANVTVAINDVIIHDNKISSLQTLSASYSNAIELGKIMYLKISNNTFNGIIGRVITAGNANTDESYIRFIHNEVIDCGKTSTAAYKIALCFYLGGTIKYKLLDISNNTFINTSTQYMTKAWDSNSLVANLIVSENKIVNLPAEFSWTNSASNDYLMINHIGTGSPEGLITASVGSIWIDKVTSIKWVKILSNKDSVGWRQVEYGTAAPTTGAHKIGDKVINTNPIAGGYEGWVCITNATPGTWKGYGTIQL